MVEVFKTNVSNRDHANLLIGVIRKSFGDYRATFDLEDCDHVLRVQSLEGQICTEKIIALVSYYGYTARVMEDELTEAQPSAEQSGVLEFIFNYQ